MASDAEAWWSVMKDYAPLQPYFQYLNVTEGSANLINMVNGWRTLLLQADPIKYPESAIGGKPSKLVKSDALAFFVRQYGKLQRPPADSSLYTLNPNPTYNQTLWISEYDIIKPEPEPEPEPEPISLPSIYGAQYVPGVEPEPVVVI